MGLFDGFNSGGGAGSIADLLQKFQQNGQQQTGNDSAMPGALAPFLQGGQQPNGMMPTAPNGSPPTGVMSYTDPNMPPPTGVMPTTGVQPNGVMGVAPQSGNQASMVASQGGAGNQINPTGVMSPSGMMGALSPYLMANQGSRA
jgi:hypothetical protein